MTCPRLTEMSFSMLEISVTFRCIVLKALGKHSVVGAGTQRILRWLEFRHHDDGSLHWLQAHTKAGQALTASTSMIQFGGTRTSGNDQKLFLDWK